MKFPVHRVKIYVINGKEALTGDWEELIRKHVVIVQWTVVSTF